MKDKVKYSQSHADVYRLFCIILYTDENLYVLLQLSYIEITFFSRSILELDSKQYYLMFHTSGAPDATPMLQSNMLLLLDCVWCLMLKPPKHIHSCVGV